MWNIPPRHMGRETQAMMDDRAPDEIINVTVDGYNVVAYSFGSGDEVLFCVNGGPGLPCDYLRDSHSWLADKGYRVVSFDQLGTGKSDRPDDEALWTIERYVEETETVRTALGLGPVHYLGQSWGTWLGQEWALAYPESFKTITLADGAGDIPHLVSELHRLRQALGPETVAMMQRHEAEGTLEHPTYQAAITILNYRHVCRLDEWPAPVMRSLGDWNMAPYMAIQGPQRVLLHRQHQGQELAPRTAPGASAGAGALRPARRAHAGVLHEDRGGAPQRPDQGVPELVPPADVRGAGGLFRDPARLPRRPSRLAPTGGEKNGRQTSCCNSEGTHHRVVWRGTNIELRPRRSGIG